MVDGSCGVGDGAVCGRLKTEVDEGLGRVGEM